MLTHNVNDRHASASCSVQVGGHASIAIRGSCNDAFKKAEHAADFCNLIKRGNDVDFRCPWFAKQVSIPPATGVRTRLSAPFILFLDI